jgi:hypothetical protein
MAMIEYTMAELLEMAGAKIYRGNRADCPKCHHRRTIAYTSEVFFCHEISCGWKGNTVTLAKELGLLQRMAPAEYQRQHRERVQALEMAARHYEQLHARQLEVLSNLRMLGRIEVTAHDAGANDPQTWGILNLVCTERPGMLVELLILENCGARDALSFLAADSQTRAKRIAEVIERGGLCDSDGRFVELDL